MNAIAIINSNSTSNMSAFELFFFLSRSFLSNILMLTITHDYVARHICRCFCSSSLLFVGMNYGARFIYSFCTPNELDGTGFPNVVMRSYLLFNFQKQIENTLCALNPLKKSTSWCCPFDRVSIKIDNRRIFSVRRMTNAFFTFFESKFKR